MFFYAAKLIGFLLQPSAALLIALAGGVLAIGLGSVKLGSILVLLATIGLLAAGFSPLGPALLLPLEERFQRTEPDGPVDGILVLGGGIDQHVGETREIVELGEAGDRMTEAVALAGRFPEARIVFTGGSAKLIPEGFTEGAAARRFFRAMGLPDARVTIEAGQPQHGRERRILGSAGRREAGGAVVAGYLGLPHAAGHGQLSGRRLVASGLAHGLPHARTHGPLPANLAAVARPEPCRHRGQGVDRARRLPPDRAHGRAVSAADRFFRSRIAGPASGVSPASGASAPATGAPIR